MINESIIVELSSNFSQTTSTIFVRVTFSRIERLAARLECNIFGGKCTYLRIPLYGLSVYT